MRIRGGHRLGHLLVGNPHLRGRCPPAGDNDPFVFVVAWREAAVNDRLIKITTALAVVAVAAIAAIISYADFVRLSALGRRLHI